MELTYDVAIVGARCAGSALARLLAQAGLRVLAIDRARFPSDTRSTHCISTTGTELLHAWGVLDDVRALGAPNCWELQVSTPSRSAVFPLPADGHGLIAPRRTVLDKLLVDLARAAGAEVWEGVTFAGLLHDSNGAVSGLRCRQPDGTSVAVHASVVVGADGVDSAVAAEVDAATYAIRPSACAGVYAYYVDSGIDDFGISLAERRLALAFPTSGGEVCLAVCGHADDARHLNRGGDQAAVRFAKEVAPHVADAMRRGRRTSRLFVIHPREGRYRVPYGKGWALVGDAGHYLDPITGQGMSNAFLGAALLGQALIDGVSGARALQSGLAEYQHQRDELTMAVHDTTHELATFGWDEQHGIDLILTYRTLVDGGRQHVLNLSTPLVAS